YVYLFDRATGRPLFDLEERRVPASNVPGEEAWPSQPIPVKPPPFARQVFTGDSRGYVAGPIFTPPSLRGTVVFPGFHGGASWSGASFDPATGMLYVNSNNVPWVMKLVEAKPGSGYRYNHDGYNRFVDDEGYPAVAPPWGNLTALDLRKGTIAWQVTLGEFPELTRRGLPPTGTENLGGTIVTAGGLVFIGATMDEKFRAFDSATGRVLWEHQLDAGAYATPAAYMAGGKQYVVVAAGGGGKLRTRTGDAYVAFALPGRD
ncbi:MAG: PQQ-binding-like beta-propeller repeat protein, partial [Bryobacteraceae bacterium]